MATALTFDATAAGATCDDCYFRCEGLCALDEGPCPTFRPTREQLAPPPQAPLVEPTAAARPRIRAVA